LKITVTAEEPKDNKVAAKVEVAKADVNKAVEKAYKDISHKYNFQGFRKGHTPRPVIDSMVGRDAVLADATNALINDAEPLMLDELDLVPVADVDYGEDVATVVEGEPFVIAATIEVRPTCELDSYDAPSIEMPPEEVTDAEVDEQLDVLKGYHTTFEDIKEDRGVQKGDVVQADIEAVKNADQLAGTNRMFVIGESAFPGEFDDAVCGMKAGDEKEVSFSTAEKKADEADDAAETEDAKDDDANEVTVKVKVTAIKERVVPEIDDELAKKAFGFDTVADLKDAVKSEIADDKKRNLPGLKEDRVVEAIEKHLTLEEVPENYVNQVFREIGQTVLQRLQQQGMTLDSYLQMNHINSSEFFADLQAQATERARQSLALDALAQHLGLEATDEDLTDEFKGAGSDDPKAAIESFRKDGRLPAVRESIKRTKAVDWLIENVDVSLVDEVAKRRAEKDAADDASDKKDDAAADAE
jgi:trigger factor